MILDKEEIDQRLASPLNLLNRLKTLTSPVVSIPPDLRRSTESRLESSLFTPPSVDELVDGIEDKLNTAKCKSGAKEVLATAIESLKVRVGEVDDAMKLSRIATDMGKIVNGFESVKGSNPTNIIPIIYRPLMMVEANFQTIQAVD